jgi:hypothetical protein
MGLRPNPEEATLQLTLQNKSRGSLGVLGVDYRASKPLAYGHQTTHYQSRDLRVALSLLTGIDKAEEAVSSSLEGFALGYVFIASLAALLPYKNSRHIPTIPLHIPAHTALPTHSAMYVQFKITLVIFVLVYSLRHLHGCHILKQSTALTSQYDQGPRPRRP